MNNDHEADVADQMLAAESEVVRLRAELAAVDAALAGEPVPNPSERVRRVAELSRPACNGCKLASATSSRCALHDRPSAPEDDGLTAADRAAGWRWETAYGVWHLYTPIGVLVAVVDDEGWVARVRGPETGAAGQRAAVRALRKAGALSGGERSGT